MVCDFCGLSDRTEMIVTDLPDYPIRGITPPIHLPSLPALTTLVIEVCMCGPSPRLSRILCSIGSAPALTSISIECVDWDTIIRPLEDPWVDMDRWLSRIAKHAKVKGSFTLTLTGWPEGKSVWKDSCPSSGSLEAKSRWTVVRRADGKNTRKSSF
jgi:hypothetical protein